MRRVLKSTLARVERLEGKAMPQAAGLTDRQDVRKMSCEALENDLVKLLDATVGLPDTFETAEAFIAACEAPVGQQDSADGVALLRQHWERARWFKHHASHGSFRLGPRWCAKPLLSCVCGGHLKVYRVFIPGPFWNRISEDDEPRTEFYYPMHPTGASH